ncbi:alpha-1,2-galactosyltransferase-like protein [Metarhizium album ARSEF 1941]|uniref:Alpha-1,2-galactosyltransferase-like protein n=1 Tax=Metarhizium album (strain ARSEF 1941) TaxID=1081103 RepID=A0A0B2WVX8_METAS|nr:alpha-1,2-galactosyltransferase-like protein [Metarhizium album ARSEF 1941]KHN97739.1 alpha-1,2-galactosyltransferase-like protein [Metarhizium album ARSEF 1941]
MHLPYPPRKRSSPPPFRPMSSNISLLRRSRLKSISIGALLFFGVLYFLCGGKKPDPYHEHVPSGHPSVVLVTVIDPSEWDPAYLATIKENREKYAARHGYQAMVVNALDYDTQGSPRSWAKIFAMRHALSKYPDCKFIWYLDQDAYIMDPTKSLDDQVTRPSRLESLMIKDYPVVPPDSIIKTFSHLRGENIDFIVSQDKEGLVHKSVVIRNGEFAKFFVETWFDPLYRSYNFQKAERHALEHIVQWHPTILSKLALVPQRTLASYSQSDAGERYQEGDFVVLFHGCTNTGEQSCQTESSPYWEKLKKAMGIP